MNIRKLYFVIYSAIFIVLISCNKEEQPKTETPSYKLVWKDNFDGTSLNLNDWKFETGATGWGNNELQNYVNEGATEVSNGTLKILAKKIGPKQEVGNYVSARLNSKRTFTYGKIEVRAKLPQEAGNGLWPAIWMLGNDTYDWPERGEIDIMEYVSFRPNTVFSAIHSVANNHRNGTALSSGKIDLNTAEEEFHNYGILWEEKFIKFYIDDVSNVTFTLQKPENSTNDDWPFNKPFFLLLNMAVGGNWGGQKGVDDAIFPATFEIDYVKVYQKKD